MQFMIETAGLAAVRAFSAPARCPHCDDWMVAPVSSEFVEGGVGCDAADGRLPGVEVSATIIDLDETAVAA